LIGKGKEDSELSTDAGFLCNNICVMVLEFRDMIKCAA
jgi:hypothetical protein